MNIIEVGAPHYQNSHDPVMEQKMAALITHHPDFITAHEDIPLEPYIPIDTEASRWLDEMQKKIPTLTQPTPIDPDLLQFIREVGDSSGRTILYESTRRNKKLDMQKAKIQEILAMTAATVEDLSKYSLTVLRKALHQAKTLEFKADVRASQYCRDAAYYPADRAIYHQAEQDMRRYRDLCVVLSAAIKLK
jgi:hypothetical protein